MDWSILKLMTDELKTLRGIEYTECLDAIWNECGVNLAGDADEMHPLTPVKIGILCLKYDINFKAVCDYLESDGILPTGTHRKVTKSLKVRDILEEAQRVMDGKVALD